MQSNFGYVPAQNNDAAYFLFQHPVFKGKYHEGSPSSKRPDVVEWLKGHDATIVEVLRKIEESYSESPPYHNYDHAVLVADMSVHLARQHRLPDRQILMCAFAGLLHDSLHIGAADDYDNVVRAMSFAFGLLSTLTFSDAERNTIIEAIECTRFDAQSRSFPVAPSSIVGRILRDADLLNCMYVSWPNRITRLGLELNMPDLYTTKGFYCFMIDHSAFMGARTSMSDTDDITPVKTMLDDYVSDVRHVLMNCRFL